MLLLDRKHIAVRLESSNVECIWCRRRLLHPSFSVDCTEGFGPRPRSEEHIIPKSLFGRVFTDDLCVCCNSGFGSEFDHAFARDSRVVEAAQRVGISLTQIWSEFEGVQRTPDGREFRTAVKGGVFRPKPSLKSLDSLAIASTDGQFYEEDLKNLRARLIAKVKGKALGLGEARIISEVDSLIEIVRSEPTAEHYNSSIQEGFRASPLDSKVHVNWSTRPWMTEWCLAKMVFEFSQTTLSREYRQYFAPAMAEVRAFLDKRECSEDGRAGVGVFTFVELPPSDSARLHIVEGRMTERAFEWDLTFFGTAKWSYSREVKPICAPAAPQTIRIVNPIEGPDASVVVV